MDLVEVRRSGQVGTELFQCKGLEFEVGDCCIVEAEKGLDYGVVVTGKIISRQPKEGADEPFRVLRKGTGDDLGRIDRLEKQAEEASRLFARKVEDHDLEMKLVDVNYAFDGRRVTFYFTSDGRVDFRSLIKDLAHVLKTRIELRQIGVRDEARIVGGYGTCGCELCCASFLNEFRPVSIRMAKDQNLALGPSKIAGACGRLMCCLAYEHQFYQQLRTVYPKVGSKVSVGEVRGVVSSVNLLCDRITVNLEEIGARSYNLEEFNEATGRPPPSADVRAKAGKGNGGGKTADKEGNRGKRRRA